MKQFVTLLASLLISLSLTAQSRTGKVSGTLTGADEKPIYAATVQLMSAADKKLVKTEITSKTGEYSFENLRETNCFIAL